MSFDFGNLLKQYLGGANDSNPAQTENDFDRVAQQAPRGDLAQGVTQALRSDQTPPFANMVEHLFNNGSPDQRAGMLNQLLASVGPGILSSIAGGALGNLMGAHQAQVSPEQASQVPPGAVRELAEQAQQQNPSVVDRMGDFYADHPNLVKALGGAALAIALGHMAQGMQRH
jgi:hypothetical protein